MAKKPAKKKAPPKKKPAKKLVQGAGCGTEVTPPNPGDTV